MLQARFTAFTDSPNGRQRVAQSNNQNEAWGLAMVATKHNAQQEPALLHAAVLFDNVTGVQLATMPYKQPCQSRK